MFLDRDGLRLFYQDQGEGEPVLLFVHGWTMSHEVWREQVAAFSKTHRFPAANRYMHAHIPNSEIHEFPGKGHTPFLTDVEAFNLRLRAFVSG